MRTTALLAPSSLLLLAACAPADSGSLDPVLPAALHEAVLAGDAPLAIVEIATPEIDSTIAAARTSADHAGDRLELREARAAMWAEIAEELVDATPLDARPLHNLPFLLVSLDDLDEAEALALHPRVRAMEPDTANEAFLTQSLGLIDQAGAEAAGFTGAGVSVAVLDTGADWTEADLGSCTAVGTPTSCRVRYAADVATSDGSRDDNGHGTNVSAIVAAVAPDADILALDVFQSDGYAYNSDIITAIDWVVTNKDTYDIAALNMSLGSGAYTAACSGSFNTSISAAKAAGVSVVVASGNNGYTNAISSPACVSDAVAVGAVYDTNLGGLGWSTCTDWTTAADKVTCFSNSATILDVLAPGALIVAGGETMGGTSQASPHVAGAMAVLRAANPTASATELESKLIDNGTTVTDSRNGLSFPRLDLAAAMEDCVTAISATAISAAAAGSSGTVDVTASAGCDWTASSDSTWLSIDATSGTGTGDIGWSAAANTGSARTGQLVVSGRAITVTQAGDSGPTGTISIAGGAAGTKTTTVTLSLSASDSTGGVSQMCISNSTSCTAWETYSSSKSWSLSSTTGTKTVYATFKDAYGNVSSTVSDTIVYDTTKPTNGTVTVTPANGQATVSWTGYSDAGAGLSSYTLVYGTSSPASSCTSGTSGYSGSGTSATVTGLTNGTSYTFRVCATDGAGNTSTGSTASGTPAPEFVGPTGSISINSGATYATSTSTTVTLSASDASGVSYACLSNSSTCSSWFTMTTSKSWALGGTGSRTLYGWFKDPYGNISSVVTDTIVVDTTKPTNGTVTATPSSGQMALSWSGFSDSVGIASYTVVYGTSSPSSCSAGTVAYSGTGTSTTLTGLTNGTTVYARVCATDLAGNLSTGTSAYGTPAPEYNLPTGSISINSGATWTTSGSVTVTASATDDTGVAQMCFSTSSTCSSWKTYASSGTASLGSTAGTRTLYAWFKDSWGNVSTSVTDTIGYDATAPSGGSFTATATSGGASLSWGSFTDATSGVASYTLVGSTSASPSSCSGGTALYSGTGTSTSVSGYTTGQKLYVRLCPVDVAGNTGSGKTATVTVL